MIEHARLRHSFGALGLAACTLLAATACRSTAAGAWRSAPETRIAVAVDTLHGVAIEDPYRWLEDQDAPAVHDWIARQASYAEQVMGPENALRRSLRARLTELMDTPSPGNARKAGEWEYFTLRRPGEPVAAIYRRRASAKPSLVVPDSQYELVVDPLALRADGTTSVNIEGFSSDGRLMMYSVRDGGPDEISVYVRDLTTGQNLPDSLPRALYSSLSFAPDDKGIYYVHRSRQAGPRFRHHLFGDNAARDSVLFGEGYGPTAFLNVMRGAGGRYQVFTVGYGWARNEVHVQDSTRPGAVLHLTQGLDAHFAPQFVGGQLWMRTDLGAPRGRVVAVDLERPSPSDWAEIIPQGSDVLDSFTEIEGKIYVTWIRDVSHRITIHEKTGRQVGEIPLPPSVSATIRGGDPGKARLTVTSFNLPSITWSVDVATGARTLDEPSKIPFDTSSVSMTQVWYRSADGTRAPMYLLHKRGFVRSSDTPVLLSGYGGFAVSLMPRFDPRAAAWVERGGVFAQATLRGGNEFGEDWHRGGMLTNKQRVFDDFLAAARHLVDSGYTSPQRLTIRGGSNGGLLMGSAITQRPDLFRAAFIGVPDLDMVRFHTFTTHNNMPALLEYGDASKREEFEAIRQYSPYQNVRNGVAYPAVMVQTGINDTRVPPWQARKFTARLQAATSSGLPVILFHDMRSGHAGGRTTAGNIELAARELEFLLRMVGAR